MSQCDVKAFPSSLVSLTSSCSLQRSSTTFLEMTIVRKVADILSAKEESFSLTSFNCHCQGYFGFCRRKLEKIPAVHRRNNYSSLHRKANTENSIAWSSTSGKTFSVVLSFRSVLKTQNNKNIFFSYPVMIEHLEHFISLWYECFIYIIRKLREGGGERIKKPDDLICCCVVVAIEDNLSSRTSFGLPTSECPSAIWYLPSPNKTQPSSIRISDSSIFKWNK